MIARAAVAEDFLHIEIQPMQTLRGVVLNMSMAQAVMKISHALTVLDAKNRVLAIAGVTETQPDTIFVWVFLSKDAGRYMLGLTRLLRRAMRENTRGYKTIETLVRSDFGPGHRWAKMFGFACVQPGRSRDPDGILEDLYRRAA